MQLHALAKWAVRRAKRLARLERRKRTRDGSVRRPNLFSQSFEPMEPRILLSGESLIDAPQDEAALVVQGNQLSAPQLQSVATVTGELMQWHNVTLTFDGPNTSENATTNPFRDYRLDVTFTGPNNQTYVVAGYYAADGNAAETSASSGDKWRVHFNPDQVGTWTYTVSFRTGTDVAVSSNPLAGTAGVLDGITGSLTIAASDKTGDDFRAKGQLQYVGENYLQFAGNGEYFIKTGAGSPENFLGYAGFDQTSDLGGINEPGLVNGLHNYAPHIADWQEGDPTWKNGEGKGIIGSLNYLASKGMNSMYMLTYNIDGGDGRDVWMWNSPTEKFRFDVSKLDQWEIVFSHMEELGIQMHILMQEQENDQALGGLTTQRKLYYRELIARFGHHNAIVWNLGEENTNTTKERKDFANYIREIDPYDHAIAMHTFPGDYAQEYTPLLGFENFEIVSLQTKPVYPSHIETNTWITQSAQAGRQWIAYVDEIGPAIDGVLPDSVDPNHDTPRMEDLWGNLMAGGAGVEWYFGYAQPHNDVALEDFRSRDKMWDQSLYAADFFRNHLPFWAMEQMDNITPDSTDYVYGLEGEIFANYVRDSIGTLQINLGSTPDTYSVQWYNPRAGGALQTGTVTTVVANGGLVNIGHAPSDLSKDWVALLVRQGPPSDPPTATEDGFTVIEDSTDNALDVLVNDQINSVIATGLTITGVSAGSQGGTIQIAGDGLSLVYTPAEGFFGTETFTYTINDGRPDADATATVTMTVEANNNQPTADDDSFTVLRNAATTNLDVLDGDTDPDVGDTLTVVGVSVGSAGGTIEIALDGLSINYTPATDFVGEETFTYTVSDGDLTDTATVTVTVELPPLPPDAVDDAFTVEWNSGTTSLDVLADDSDPNSDDLTITEVSVGSQGGTIEIALDGLSINYTPAENFFGEETFTYTISDGSQTDTATVTMTVEYVNHKPEAGDDEFLVAQNSGVTSFDVLSNDSDPDSIDTLTITQVSAGSAGGTIEVALDGLSINYTPATDYFGEETFTYTISDGDMTDTAVVTVTVDPPPSPPVADDDTFTVEWNTSNHTLDVLDGDTDPNANTTLTITQVSAGSAGGTIEIAQDGLSIIYTPVEDFLGDETFTYTVSDGVLTDTGQVTVSAIFVNHEPEADDDAFTVVGNSGVTNFDVLDGDTDPNEADTLTITDVSAGSAGGTIEIAEDGLSINYTPATDYVGEETFTYTVSDGELTDTATVTVMVEQFNRPPVADDDEFTTDINSPMITLDVLDGDTDPDDDTLTITGVSAGSAGGTIAISEDGLSIEYTPAEDFFGDETFTYTVSDGELTDTGQVTVHVIKDFILVDFDEQNVDSYGGSTQDVNGEATVYTDGAVLELTGNTWKSIALDYFVTEDTILEFDFKSTRQGEVHGIGFDNDNVVGEEYTFALYGTQTWGIQDHRDYAGSAGEWKHYQIRVGDFYTGQFDRLFFGMDHDKNNPTGQSLFANVLIYDDDGNNPTPPPTPGGDPAPPPAPEHAINFNEHTVLSYGGSGQDINGVAEVQHDGQTLKLTGNTWKRIAFPYTITSETILEFDFRSDIEGEVHTIGFDTDNGISDNRSFELYGTQTWGIQDFNNYNDPTAQWKHYTIRVGDFYTGAVNSLFFGMDHDVVSPTGESLFANIDIYEESDRANQQPSADDDSFTVFRNAGLTVLNVLDGDSDPDEGDTIAITDVSSGSAGGTINISGDGLSIEYTPATDYVGDETFTYTISDGELTDTATVTMSVILPPLPPVADDETFTVEWNTGATNFDVLDGDTDPNQDDLTITDVSVGSQGGTIEIAEDGLSINYTPAENFFGEETFTYTVSDGVLTDTGTVTVTVEYVNHQPTADDDTFSVFRNTGPNSLDVLDGDTDPDNIDTLTVTQVSAGSAGGTIEIAPDGFSINYTPATDFVGDETFTYTVSDGDLTDTATVMVTVEIPPLPPDAVDDAFTVEWNSGTTSLDVLADDSDPNSDDLTITDVSVGSQGGTIEIAQDGLSINYTPAENFFGEETFTYTISDGSQTDTATVTMTVEYVNHQPTAQDDEFTVFRNSGVTNFDVLADDSDPDTIDTLIVTQVSAGSAGGTIEIALDGLSINYTPATDYVGEETFTYTVSDGDMTDTATVTVNVELPPLPPVAEDDAFTVEWNSGTTNLDVLADDSDPNGDDLTITDVSVGSQGGTIEIALDGLSINYTPAENFFGEETFTYTVSDGSQTDTATVTMTVEHVNHQPTAQDDEFTVFRNSGPNNFDVLADDSDPDTIDTLTVTGVSVGSAGGTIEIALDGLSINYTPATDFVGEETFTYTISDGDMTDTATVTVNVEIPPLPPVAGDDAFTVEWNSGVTNLDVLGDDTDPNGDDLTITDVSGGSQGGTIEIAPDGLSINYTPAENFFGEETFTYTVSDGSQTDTATVTMTVEYVNHQPTAQDDEFTVFRNSGPNNFDVLADDSDPDTIDTLTVTGVSAGSAGGTIEIAEDGLSINYTPATDYVGEETFTYTISDGDMTDTATVTVNVEIPPLPPVAEDDAFTVEWNSGTTNLDVLSDDSDPNNDDLTITDVSVGSQGGTIEIAPDSLSINYTPAENFFGEETFTYTISDGSQTDTATVTMTVEHVNHQPVAQDDEFTVVGNSGTTNFDVLNDDTDPDTIDTLTITQVSVGSAGGTIEIALDGLSINYTPATDFVGEETFTYTISDGDLTDTATVTVTVDPFNQPPVANTDEFTVNQNAGATFLDVLANDTDRDVDEIDLLALTNVSAGSAGGTTEISEDGAWIVYTPAPGFSGEETFTYTVSDGTQTDVGQVTVTVVEQTGPEPVIIDFDDYTIQSYGGSHQDASGGATTENDGVTVKLEGNTWKRILLNYEITSETVIEFDFHSTSEGEVHGIGFDSDNGISSDRTFQLHGTQTWGIQSFNNYSPGDGWKHYQINVGQFYTGNLSHLIFAMDHDVPNPTGVSRFANIRIYESSNPPAGDPPPSPPDPTTTEPPVDPDALNFSQLNVTSFDSGDQDQGSFVVQDNGNTLKLFGNSWKKVGLNFNVTANTVIEFDFYSPSQAEVQGIGLDNDDDLNQDFFFQLYGTQTWGIQSFNNYSSGDGWKRYQINVGQFYTGNMNYITFGNDHDVNNPTGESFFRNVKIYNV